MNKAHLGLIILALTCLQWGWVTPRQAQAQQVALATNLTPNQQIISDLKVFLDNQRRDFGNTPQNNAYLRQIQNLIKIHFHRDCMKTWLNLYPIRSQVIVYQPNRNWPNS